MPKKRLFYLSIFCALLFSTGAIGDEPAHTNGVVSVAVLDIQSNYPLDRKTGIEISNAITRELAKLGKFKVLDRRTRDESLMDAGFGQYPCAFESCAVAAGKALNVNLVLFGVIVKIGDTYALDLGVAHSETGDAENSAGKICAACETQDMFEFFVTSAFRLLGETPPLEIPAPASSSASDDKFSGAWQTNWGVVELKQVGAKVVGSYSYDQVEGKIFNGTIIADRLDFLWEQYGNTGDAYFYVSEDGATIEGRWREGFSGKWSGEWFGVRQDVFSEAAPPAPELDISGTWKTSRGTLCIVQKGNSISGKYEGDGRILGRLKGNRVEYKWRDSGKIGDGYFVVSGNGKAILGKWRTGFSGAWKGDYIGIKKREKNS